MKNDKLNKKNELNKWDNKYLSSVKYRNGEEIKLAKNKEEWNQNNKEEIGCYCYFLFNDKKHKMGLFYNFFAVIDSRNICPIGLRIPKKEDYSNLIEVLKSGRDLFNCFVNLQKKDKTQLEFNGCLNNNFFTGFDEYWWLNDIYMKNNERAYCMRFDTRIISVLKMPRSKYCGMHVKCIKE